MKLIPKQMRIFAIIVFAHCAFTSLLLCYVLYRPYTGKTGEFRGNSIAISGSDGIEYGKIIANDGNISLNLVTMNGKSIITLSASDTSADVRISNSMSINVGISANNEFASIYLHNTASSSDRFELRLENGKMIVLFASQPIATIFYDHDQKLVKMKSFIQ